MPDAYIWKQIDGTVITDAEGSAAYQPDEDSRMQTVLELFYQEQ